MTKYYVEIILKENIGGKKKRLCEAKNMTIAYDDIVDRGQWNER